VDIEKLKQDKEFMEQLEERRLEACRNNDIKELHDLLDTYLYLDMDAEEIDLLFREILDIAFDRLAHMLSDGEKFDFSNEFDLYTARAVYEHALERWNNENFKGANELFLLLSYMTPRNFKKAMILPLGLTAKKIPLNQFLEEYIDTTKLNENSFFLDTLNSKAKKFIAEHRELIQKELEKTKKWSK